MPPDPETAPALDESLVGSKVHKYEIVRVIGRGGMGMVYEAVNTTIGKRVAMKFVDAELARNKDAVARFQREAQAASAVESAHIVEIFDSGFTEEGLPFIVMELLRGEDLGHRIKRCGRLDLGEALHIAAQILRGLHRAHEAGIVHRDLKPDNIFLVDRDDDPNFTKILDFGISKVQRRGDVPSHTLTREGTVLGTPFYMSPEQAQAMSDVDGRTDLWSLGAILYECLTGRAPHSGNSYEQVIVNICTKDADDVRLHNPGVPEGIARVVAKALTREREGRFGNAREFLDALVANGTGVLSTRMGRVSGEDARSTPTAPARTGDSGGGTQRLGYAPTIDVLAQNSRVGWATSGGTAPHRDRRIYFVVGGASLIIGATIVAALKWNGEPVAPVPAAAAMDATSAEITLSSNAEGARFVVDGAAIPGGVLRGTKGEKKKVHVEADGYAPLDTEIEIDPSQGPKRIELTRLEVQPPQVAPGPTATEAAPPATATPTVTATGKATRPPPKPKPAPPAKTAEPVAPPAAPPPPKPEATGVAGGLKLKLD